jgi:hypothetical protein
MVTSVERAGHAAKYSSLTKMNAAGLQQILLLVGLWTVEFGLVE